MKGNYMQLFRSPFVAAASQSDAIWYLSPLMRKGLNSYNYTGDI